MESGQTSSTEMLQEAIALLQGATTVVITSHKFPDGDAVGSCLALAGLLRAQGKNVQVVLPKTDVGRPAVLNGFAEVTDLDDFDFDAPCDLLAVLDCATPRRICDPRFLQIHSSRGILNIDHHGEEYFGNQNIVVPDLSSTGELVFDLAQAAGWTLDRDCAEALWTAIASDTDCFTLPATTANTLLCAASLHRCGIRANWLNDQLFRQVAVKTLQLQARALTSLELWNGGQVATISLTPEDFRQTGCAKQHSEAFPSIPLSVADAKFAIFFYPMPIDNPNQTRLSIRSRPTSHITARKLAEFFHGGGHTHAAAATVPISLPEARQAAKSFLEKHQP